MRVQPLLPGKTDGAFDHREFLCLTIRGSTGRGTGFGRLRFAAASFGDTRRVAGTYQRRKLRQDKSVYNPQTNPDYPVVAMRTYRPTYTNTEIQDENRAKFAAAVAYWQGLTDLEKELYDERGAKRNLPGYNIAISDFMRYYDYAP